MRVRWLLVTVLAVPAFFGGSLAYSQVSSPPPGAPAAANPGTITPAQTPPVPSANVLLSQMPATGEPVSPPIEGAAPTSASGNHFNVESGRHLLEFRGSGINGPYHGEAERWLDFGILIQTEFIHNSPSSGPDSEHVFFRRLRPTIIGGIENWQAILQMDFGAGEDGTASATTVRWVNFQYTGFYQAHATFGSFKPWFSRELITLGPHLQTIERSPVGDTNYGNPDYMIGAAWDQMLENRKVAYYASVGLQDHEQSATQMQMRSPANAASGANQGWLATGRLDFYPIGQMPYNPNPLHTPAQIAYNRGDFHTDAWRLIMSTAVFGWWNDGNSNPDTVNGVSTSTSKADLNRSFGAEASGGVRGFGFSADAEYQFIRGETVDPNFTGGLYVGGRTNLNKFSANGGYMLPCDVELVGGWSIVDATGFERGLTETKVGFNWYVMKYAVRFSATYSFLNNNNGIPGNNIGVTRAYAQFVW